MASENKKKKDKNLNSCHGFALKEKNSKHKRFLFYNSAKRQESKKMVRQLKNNNNQIGERK